MRALLVTSLAACMAISGAASAGNPVHAACGSLENVALVRECMLDRQIEDTRVGGSEFRVGSNALTDDDLEVLRVRQQMAEMTEERDRMVLLPIRSDNGLATIFPILLLFLLAGIGGSSGEPFSPS